MRTGKVPNILLTTDLPKITFHGGERREELVNIGVPVREVLIEPVEVPIPRISPPESPVPQPLLKESPDEHDAGQD